MSSLEGLHGSTMQCVGVGNVMMDEVARHGDEQTCQNEQEVGGLRCGVGGGWWRHGEISGRAP
jgi:hypothetical protein